MVIYFKLDGAYKHVYKNITQIRLGLYVFDDVCKCSRDFSCVSRKLSEQDFR